MELTFQSKPLCYLGCMIDEFCRQEETSEIIVPDSFPDIMCILDANAEAILRGKDCRNGNAILSGGIKGRILYLAEGEELPRCLETYLPFSIKMEHAELTEYSQLICTIQVRSADGRMVNSRKAMLRTELSCRIVAYEDKKEDILELEKWPDYVQIRQEEYKVFLPLESSEKAFKVGDSLELPGASSECHIYQCFCVPEVAQTKLVGNKALFKGQVQCKILYSGNDQRLHVYRHQLPFSQYCEFNSDFEDEIVDCYPVITGYDLQPEQELSSNAFSINVHLLMQAVVSGRRTVVIPSDAYAVHGSLDAEWKKYTLTVSLDRQILSQTLRCQMNGPVIDVIDWEVYPDNPVWNRRADETQIIMGVGLHVLGYDREGKLCSSNHYLQGETSLALAANSSCACHHTSVGSVYLSPCASGLDAQVDISVVAMCSSEQIISGLCAGTVEKDNAEKERRPSVILKRITKETELWEIAKYTRTKAEAIQAANSIENDIISPGEILLIPIG